MNNFEYKITRQLGVLSQTEDGEYTKEVNLISFNGAEPKVDIRRWDRRAGRMQKGITLDRAELEALTAILCALKEEAATAAGAEGGTI